MVPQLLQPAELLLDGGRRFGSGAGPVGDLGPELARFPLPLRGGLVGPFPHPAVELEAQEADEHVLPVAGLVGQEPGELTLGQHDAPGEVVEGHPQHRPGDGGVELGDRAGQHLDGGFVAVAGGDLEAGLTGDGLPVGLAPYDADGGVAPAVGVEGEADPGLGRAAGDHVPHPVRAKHMASMIVLLPDPVGPTRAM